MTEKTKRIIEKTLSVLSWTIIGCWTAVVLYAGIRIFVCDQFITPTHSMAPTLIPGDRVLVNKLICGARIYKNLDFNDSIPMRCWRSWGLRKVRPNDVIVFNFPKGYDRPKIEFKINYVYCKRCIGTPGDTIWVKDGFYRNNNYEGVIGLSLCQSELASTPDSIIPDNVIHALPFDKKNYGWTIKNMGPLYIPKKGDSIALDEINYKIYKLVVEYETGSKLSVRHGVLSLDGKPFSGHRFKHDYYFAGGDNVSNSGDSRYWGFIPEEFIVGVATRIPYSKDRNTGRMRWDRLWKKIT